VKIVLAFTKHFLHFPFESPKTLSQDAPSEVAAGAWIQSSEAQAATLTRVYNEDLTNAKKAIGEEVLDNRNHIVIMMNGL
jgi:hypothetical protein